MKLWVFCFLCFAMHLTRADDSIVSLNVDNFDSVVAQGDAVVVFHEPGCHHCKDLAPNFEKAAETLKRQGSPVLLANCDISKDENKPLVDKYHIFRYPTINMFKNGSLEEPKEYEGPRNPDQLVKAIQRAFGPASTYFDRREDFEAFDGSEDVVVIGVFAGEESEAFQTYLQVAESLREAMIDLVHTFKPEAVPLCTNSESCKTPFLAVINGPDAKLATYDGAFEEDLVHKWVMKAINPRLLEYDPDNERVSEIIRKTLRKPEPRLVGFSLQTIADTPAFKEALIEANDADDSFTTLYIDPTRNEKAAKYYRMKDGDYPALVFRESITEKNYVWKNCAPSDVAAFLTAYKAGELELFLKSEEVPEDNSGPVKIVVATEFRAFMNSGKDILLEFYSSGCPYCRSVAPIYEDLGKHYEQNDNIVIGKMEAVANNIPDSRVEVPEYPTLKYFRKDGEMLDFTGNFTLPELIEFVDMALGINQNEAKKSTEFEQVQTNEQKKTEL